MLKRLMARMNMVKGLNFIICVLVYVFKCKNTTNRPSLPDFILPFVGP